MSKTIKIICTVSALLFVVACVLLGFACANVAQESPVANQPRERVIVASAGRFALPNVRIDEPMLDIEVPVDGFAPGRYKFDLSVVVPYDSWYTDKTFTFGEYSSPLTYYAFTLISTNDPFFANADSVLIDVYFSETRVQFNINAGVGSVGAKSYYLDGTLNYYYEVEADEVFTVSDDVGQVVSDIPVPSAFFRPVGRGVFIVEELIGILVSGLTGIGEAIGGSLSEMAAAIFIADDGLSVFGVLIAVFAAISLGLSLTRWVLNFVTSWGNRNR